MSSSSRNDSLFDPAELFAFAQWLFDTKPALSSSCLRRTIINRAYYASLICARDATGSATVGDGGHYNVVLALKKKDKLAGNELDELRKTRKIADYSPDKTITPRDVELALSSSRKVLQFLGKLPPSRTVDYLDSRKFFCKTQESGAFAEDAKP